MDRSHRVARHIDPDLTENKRNEERNTFLLRSVSGSQKL